MLGIQHNAFGGAEAGGALHLLAGVPSSGVEGLVLNHGQGQLHLFGLQMRPDGRRCVRGSGCCLQHRWGAADSFLKGDVVRFGGRCRGGVGFLSEGSSWGGAGALWGLCCLLLFGFCWRMKRKKNEEKDGFKHQHIKKKKHRKQAIHVEIKLAALGNQEVMILTQWCLSVRHELMCTPPTAALGSGGFGLNHDGRSGLSAERTVLFFYGPAVILWHSLAQLVPRSDPVQYTFGVSLQNHLMGQVFDHWLRLSENTTGRTRLLAFTWYGLKEPYCNWGIIPKCR